MATTTDTLGHLGVSPTSCPFSASLTPTSQNKAGKQSPYRAPHPFLPPSQENECFLRKYKHQVLCAGASSVLLTALQVPLIFGACYTTQGASRALPWPKPPLEFHSCEEARPQEVRWVPPSHPFPPCCGTWQRPPRDPKGKGELPERSALLCNRKPVSLSEGRGKESWVSSLSWQACEWKEAVLER